MAWVSNIRYRWKITGVGLAMFFAVNSLLLAANSEPANPAGNSVAKIKMEEVVVKSAGPDSKTTAVTATKTNTPLRNIPASITVVPRNLIETQGGTSSVDTAIRNVSGVSQSGSSNYGFFNNYTIRGLNMNFLRDGVPDATTVNGYSRSLADVERVEVLKGPGSALYGSGSPGGSVNLVSKKPQKTDAYSLSNSYGSFDTYETTADMTGPVPFSKEYFSYRFIANYYNTEGFRDLDRKLFEILPTVRIDFNEDHNLTLDFDYRDMEIRTDTNGIPFQGTSLVQRNSLLKIGRDKKFYTPFGNTFQRILRYSMSDEFRVRANVLLRNNFVVLNRHLNLLRNGGGTIAAGASVMTGRSLREQTDKVTDYLYQSEQVIDFDTWQVHHTLLAGLEFQYHDVNASRFTATLPNITNIYDPVIPETSKEQLLFTPNFDREISANYESLYVQDQMDLTNQLKLRLGGRLDRFDTHVDSRLNNFLERSEDHPFSGQAGLVYRPIEPTSFYGGISRSKQAILTTESTSLLDVPEGAVQYELGNKTSLFHDKLTFDTSWFYVTRTDFLVTVGTDVIPVGKQRTKGVDFDLSLKPVEGLDLHVNYTYQDARLLSVPVATGPSVEGNRPTGVPGNILNTWATYEFQKGPLKGFGVGGGFSYKDSVSINQTNTSIVPSYITADMVLFYKRGWYEAQVNFQNLTNVTYFRNGVNGGALPGDPFGVYGTIRLHYPEPGKAV